MFGTTDETTMGETDREDVSEALSLQELLNENGAALNEGEVLSRSAELLTLESDSEVERFIEDLIAESGGAGPAAPYLREALIELRRGIYPVPPRAGIARRARAVPSNRGANDPMAQLAAAMRARAAAKAPKGEVQFEIAKEFVRFASEAAKELPTASSELTVGDMVRWLAQRPRGNTGVVGHLYEKRLAFPSPPLPVVPLARPATSSAIPFNPKEINAYAGELLSILNSHEVGMEMEMEAEMDRFLGDLLSKAWQGIKNVASSPVAKAILGGLKGVASAALPIVGGVVGNIVAPGVGGVVGSALGQGASALLGREVEEIPSDAAAMEAARQIVRLAGSAAVHAARMPASIPPHAAATAALRKAARHVAPALVDVSPDGTVGILARGCACHHPASLENPRVGRTPSLGPVDTFADLDKKSGHWRRSGARYVLHGG